jgi:hypothetical protein
MAQVDFAPTPTFRTAAPKARMTAYFAMLILAFIAMLIACLFMFLEVRNFGGFGTVPGKVSSIERAAQLQVAAAGWPVSAATAA